VTQLFTHGGRLQELQSVMLGKETTEGEKRELQKALEAGQQEDE
jgi:hypothetical protein